ncbi:MFS transporter [Furfurilactobacillus cerevisiae]|uniref:MFS transporter n=1 Tax=Furfurilactobacillus rossiae TaxID=231049 RepID=UPI003B987045
MHEYKTNRAFRTLVNVGIIDQIGSGLYSIVFLIYAATLPFKTLAVSIASIAWVIPALANIFTGYLADRTFNKRHAMWFSYFVQTILFLIIASLIGRSTKESIFFFIMALDIIARLLGDYGNSLSTPLMKHIVTPEHMNEATSIGTAIGSLVQIVASALGATLIVALHHQYDLFALLDALTFLVAGGIFFIARHQYDQAESDVHKSVLAAKTSRLAENSESKEGFGTSFKLAMQEFTQNPFLLFMIVAGLAVNLLGTAIDPLSNLIFIHMSSFWFINYGYTIALLDIVFSVGSIAGAVFVNDMLKNTSMVTLLAASMGLLVLVAIDMLTLHNLWILLVLFFGTAYLLGKINPRFNAVIINTVPDDHLAATGGVISTVMMIGAPVGQFVFLTLANVISIPVSLIIYGISSLVVTILILVRGAGRLTKNDPTTARYNEAHV